MTEKRFYQSEYWQSGEGQLLWNLRKLQSFIITICDEDTPQPFLTVMHDSDFRPTKWVAWSASWMDKNNNKSLELEYDGDSFSVWSFEDLEMGFYYDFNDEDGWDDFDKAVADAKKWLRDNRSVLDDRTQLQKLRKEFDLEP